MRIAKVRVSSFESEKSSFESEICNRHTRLPALPTVNTTLISILCLKMIFFAAVDLFIILDQI